jgi:SAM-dependent methyltransferase
MEAGNRATLLSGLSGRVLEVGCGTGLNFEFYPASVEQIVALEPDDYLRGRAEARALGHSKIVVHPGRAEELQDSPLGFPDMFDAVVFSLVLCSVADPQDVLHQARQVLRPGGQLRFYEHHVSRDRDLARRQRRLSPLWACAMGGCHPDRDIVALISAEYEVITTTEFWMKQRPEWFYEMTGPHTVGLAVPL